jgi:hypothetical protein
MNANFFSGVTLLPTAIATGLLLMTNINPESIMIFQLNYSAIVLAYQGAVHYGMAIGAYGDPLKAKAPSFVKNEDTPLTEQQIEATKDHIERTKLIDSRSPVSIESNVGFVRMLWSFLPSIMALASLGFSPLPAVVNLTIGYLALSAYDTTSTYGRMAPYWFPAHRVPHSLLMLALLVLSFGLYSIYYAQQSLRAQTEALRREVEGDQAAIPVKETSTRRVMSLEMPRPKPRSDIIESPQNEPPIDFEAELKKMEQKVA